MTPVHWPLIVALVVAAPSSLGAQTMPEEVAALAHAHRLAADPQTPPRVAVLAVHAGEMVNASSPLGGSLPTQ